MRRVGGESARSSFADDVREGLTATPKFLYPKYFYDELGSRLFEAISALPEYYVTRAEAEILRAHAGEIAGALRRADLAGGAGQRRRAEDAAADRGSARPPGDAGVRAGGHLRDRCGPEQPIPAQLLSRPAHHRLRRGVSRGACVPSAKSGPAPADPRPLPRLHPGQSRPGGAAGSAARGAAPAGPRRRLPPRSRPGETGQPADPRLRRFPGGDGGLQPQSPGAHQPRAGRGIRPCRVPPPGPLQPGLGAESRCTSRAAGTRPFRCAAWGSRSPSPAARRSTPESSYKFGPEQIRELAAETGFAVRRTWTDSPGVVRLEPAGRRLSRPSFDKERVPT